MMHAYYINYWYVHVFVLILQICQEEPASSPAACDTTPCRGP